MESIRIIAGLTGLAFLLLGGAGMVSPYTIRRNGEELLRLQDSSIKSVGAASLIISVLIFASLLGSISTTQIVASAVGAFLLIFGLFMVTPAVIKSIVKEYQYLPDNYYVLFSGVCALLGVIILYAALK